MIFTLEPALKADCLEASTKRKIKTYDTVIFRMTFAQKAPFLLLKTVFFCFLHQKHSKCNILAINLILPSLSSSRENIILFKRDWVFTFCLISINIFFKGECSSIKNKTKLVFHYCIWYFQQHSHILFELRVISSLVFQLPLSKVSSTHIYQKSKIVLEKNFRLKFVFVVFCYLYRYIY